MNKFSGLAKGLAAVAIAAGLITATAAPSTAANADKHQSVRTLDTGWG